MDKKRIKCYAYQLYKKDWCATRGYKLEDVERAFLADEQYNGEMFVSFEEFLTNEYKDTEYMTTFNQGVRGSNPRWITKTSKYELFTL